MAKITTVTNPLTGQPAQVDQLDHTAQQIDDAIARALPGGAIDITLQNKAPAGYGLGGAAKYLTADDDLNNIWQAGWYCWDAPPVNCPVFGIEGYGYVTYSMMLVLNKGGNYVSGQVIYAPSGEVLQRMYNGSLGGWQPWEWVNPPMDLGVEYRTTERYRGKPVYVKLVDCGTIPEQGTYKALVFSSDVNSIISVTAYSPMRGNTLPYYDTNGVKYSIAGSVNTVTIWNYSESLLDTDVRALIKYTKTTN